MTHPPSPHPLDFDWRYDDANAQADAEEAGYGFASNPPYALSVTLLAQSVPLRLS